MADWLSPEEREEFRAYNEKRYKEQHGHCITQIDALKQELTQLRGNLSLAEEGLANYAQEVERLRSERASAIDRLTPVGLEMGQFRRALEMIRDGAIPQAMSPALFAEFVLRGPEPQT